MALYRTYRPATFADVVGQEHVTKPLSIALDSHRINHAYLFSGPRGCGKTSSARIMARSLNCEKGPTSTPCGTCNSCIALAPGGPGSLDVTELDAASHNGVEDMRELRDRAQYAPAESRYRVFIIDEAHMITNAGANALLKIVEEPPAHLVFIFATTEPEKVLTTIRSRTHHYPFRLLTPPDMRYLLQRTFAAEHVEIDDEVYPLIIKAGGGSPRDSLSVADQLLAGAGDNAITYDMAVSLLGVTDVGLIDAAIDAIGSNDAAAVFTTIDKVITSGCDPRRFVTDLLDRLRDLMVVAKVPQAIEQGLVDAPAAHQDTILAEARAIGDARLVHLASLAASGLDDMRGATSPRLLLEILCARMLAADGVPPALSASVQASPSSQALPAHESVSTTPASTTFGNEAAGSARERARANAKAVKQRAVRAAKRTSDEDAAPVSQKAPTDTDQAPTDATRPQVTRHEQAPAAADPHPVAANPSAPDAPTALSAPAAQTTHKVEAPQAGTTQHSASPDQSQSQSPSPSTSSGPSPEPDTRVVSRDDAATDRHARPHPAPDAQAPGNEDSEGSDAVSPARQEQAPRQTQPQTRQHLDEQTLTEAWPKIVRRLSDIDADVAIAARQARVREVSDDQVYLTHHTAVWARLLASDDGAAKLAKAITDVTGYAVHITTAREDEAESSRPSQPAQAAQAAQPSHEEPPAPFDDGRAAAAPAPAQMKDDHTPAGNHPSGGDDPWPDYMPTEPEPDVEQLPPDEDVPVTIPDQPPAVCEAIPPRYLSGPLVDEDDAYASSSASSSTPQETMGNTPAVSGLDTIPDRYLAHDDDDADAVPGSNATGDNNQRGGDTSPRDAADTHPTAGGQAGSSRADASTHTARDAASARASVNRPHSHHDASQPTPAGPEPHQPSTSYTMADEEEEMITAAATADGGVKENRDSIDVAVDLFVEMAGARLV